jgi:hypothetical protein
LPLRGDMSSLAKTLSLPMLHRPLSTGAKPLSEFLGDDGFPIAVQQQQAASLAADAKKSVAAGDEIDTILEKSKALRDQFARKRDALLQEYRQAERDAEKMLKDNQKPQPTGYVWLLASASWCGWCADSPARGPPCRVRTAGVRARSCPGVCMSTLTAVLTGLGVCALGVLQAATSAGATARSQGATHTGPQPSR